MTITLTPDEVSEYEAKLNDYYMRRCEYAIGLNNSVVILGEKMCAQRMDQWSRENPKPKLLPSV